ncbi:MAG: SagB/ThcOx family dehydrogenase [Armatimonadota bacterium]
MPDGPSLDDLAALGKGMSLQLSPPRTDGPLSVEAAIARRRSVRDYRGEPIPLEMIAQLLWSAGGITAQGWFRAAPSAGACFPLEIYLACEQGLFHYLPQKHALVKLRGQDPRKALSAAAHGQQFIADAAISVIFAAVYGRTTARYGERGIRYVHMDIGHAAENVHLQAEALGLGSCPVGAFDDAAVEKVLGLPEDQRVLYIVPVGARQRD